ncbi:MAG: NADPH-dependent 7-cyano-7-deazaguanine reductase QueF [Chitinispirillaceae bacterium]|nr:NADPH-dependent 7-cyano-7-deazaguanine reductase QueF [Chitinispirillaceae bacterium]
MNARFILLDDAVKKGLLPPLETFPCPYKAKTSYSGVIRIVFPEFTCVCPRTGYPDFAEITVCYLPDKLCLELKSWKLYLNSFRMTGAFHESVTAHLFQKLKRALAPQWILVIGSFFPRGNVDTTVVFETPLKRPAGADLLIGVPPPHRRSFFPE